MWNVERWLDEELDEGQLDRWMAFDKLDPFGDERADLRSGLLGSTLANLQIASGPKLQPSHFMPFSGSGRRKRQSTRLQIAICRQIAAVHNGGDR